MATFNLQYGQSIYISIGPGGWLGGLVSAAGGSCSQSAAGNTLTSGVISNPNTQIPDEFVIMGPNGVASSGTVQYGDTVTLFNSSQGAFWQVPSGSPGCLFTSPASTSTPTQVTLLGFGNYGPTGPIQVPVYPNNPFQINQVAPSIGNYFANSMTNLVNKNAILLSEDQNTILSFVLVEAPPPPAPPSPVPLVVPPQLVAIQSEFTNTYLTVCGGCNGIPGVSVDVHATSISQGGGSVWQMISEGPGIVSFLNVLTNTYLGACQGCNGTSGASVDVSSTTSSQAAGTFWTIEDNGLITNLSTGGSIVVCEGCQAIPGGYSVVLGVGAKAVSYAQWSVQNLSPLPPLVPVGPPGPGPGPNPTPGPGPGPGPIPLNPNKPSWIFWTGVAVWAVGMLMTLLLPERFIVLRVFFIVLALVGIGAIFYSSY